MKKIAAYYLLILYAAGIARPLTVWFADAMAHVYFGHQHTAVVHREDGRNHVHYQMTKAVEDEQPSGGIPANTKADNNGAAHFASSLQFRFQGLVPPSALHNNLFSVRFQSVTLDVQLPPPRC